MDTQGASHVGRRDLRAALFCTTAAAGFVVTGTEISLGRLLAPHFGSSLVVWAAIMASVIGALSLGYPIGGAVADRHPSARLPLLALLSGGLFAAGAGIVLPFWLRDALAGVGLSGPAYWGRLALALGLFGLPCIILAAVPPAVLRVTLRDATTTGRDSGLLYGLGSLGSVLGILLPAVWWIPEVGLRASFLLLALVATVPAAAGLWLCREKGGRAPIAAALLALLALAFAPAAVRLDEGPGLTRLVDRDSGLQHIRVVASDTPSHRRRWLQLDEGWSVHSSYLEPDLVTHDIWDAMALLALSPRVEAGRTEVLILGLAGGTVANLMTRWLAPLVPELSITGVELDPAVIEVADAHLGLDRSRLRAVVADGRVWLRGSDDRFDLILLDAYHQPSIPAHMATDEFFREVRAHLTEDGLAVLNVFAPAGPSRLLDGLGATWGGVFSQPQIYTAPPATGFASRLLLSRPIVGHGRPHMSLAPRVLLAAQQRLVARTADYTPPPSVASWTDDRSPVELLSDRAFRALRPPNPPRSARTR